MASTQSFWVEAGNPTHPPHAENVKKWSNTVNSNFPLKMTTLNLFLITLTLDKGQRVNPTCNHHCSTKSTQLAIIEYIIIHTNLKVPHNLFRPHWCKIAKPKYNYIIYHCHAFEDHTHEHRVQMRHDEECDPHPME